MEDAFERAAEDAELIRRCCNGDGRAWQQLVEKYARLVHFIPVRHGLTPQEVDDVGQEVFIALAQHIQDIEHPERLAGWLSTTARRFSWRAIQKRKREQPSTAVDLSEAETVTAGDTLFDRTPSVDDLFNGWARQEALQQALARISERCRELIYRLFLDPETPSYDDVSQMLGIPKGSIGPTRIRCLQQLRERLEELGFGE